MPKNDINFENKIKDELLKTTPDLPDSLSEKNIVRTVNGRKQQPKKFNYRRFTAIAASFAVVIVAVIVGAKLYKPVSQPLASSDGSEIYCGSSADIENFFLSMRNTAIKDDLTNGVKLFGNSSKLESATSDSATNETNGTSASGSHSETDLQVGGVDEADIIKNDGKFLYVVSQTDNSKIYIIDTANPSAMSVASEITISFGDDTNAVIENLYISDNLLVAIASKNIISDTDFYAKQFGSSTCCYSGSEGREFFAVIYDVSDRMQPSETARYSIDGASVSSRLTGNKLCLISNYFVPLYNNDNELKQACIPSYYVNGNSAKVPTNKIGIVNGNEENTYTVILTVDITDSGNAPETAAILGGTSEIYCNATDLYLSRTFYEQTADNSSEIYNLNNVKTKIYRFDMTDGIVYKSACTVNGSILNQFSMDEYNGYFRIATSTFNTESTITVLDKELNVIGSLGSIAKGESIYAVRFLGDTAYVITYRQTDPLFVIDLSNPSSPSITGELKIPGVSNMLFPYSENLLIGIGADGDNSGANGKLKISLFDVSDMNNPVEISKAVVEGNSTSAAQYEHKAFLKFGDNDNFGIPVTVNDYLAGTAQNYLGVFAVSNNKLSLVQKYTSDSASGSLLRGAYTGNTVFTVCEKGVAAYDRATANVLSSVEFSALPYSYDDISSDYATVEQTTTAQPGTITIS